MLWIAIAIVFALAWVWAFHREDRLQREPVWMVGLAFLFGAVAFVPAYYLEGWLLPNSVDPEDSLAVRALALFLVVGPVEELCKFAAVRSWIYSHTHFDEPMDGIVYAVTAATGFAFAENLHFMQDMPELIWARGPGATLAHLLFAGFWGGALGWSKPMADRRAARRVVAAGLLAGIFVHGLFDLIYFCVDRELPANVARLALTALLIASFLALRFQMRRAHDYSPFRKTRDDKRP
jgi:RsiW-degrading membrane proteinase PrsW (M82 family)